MAYNKKSISERANILKQKVAIELGIDPALISTSSMIHILTMAFAGGMTELYTDFEYYIKQSIPNLADEEGVRIWGGIKNIEWITSRISAGYIVCTGINGSTIPLDALLTDDDGNEYITTETKVISSGTATVQVESVLGGLDKNLVAGTEISFISTPSGVNNIATVDVDGLLGGLDTWTYEQYRTAVLDSFKNPPKGGSTYDYQTWTNEVVDADGVWVYSYATHPSDIAKGDVEVYFKILSYTDGIPTLTDRTNVANYIDVLRPDGMGDLTCPELIAEPVDYDITLIPNTTTTQAAVEESLVNLHATLAPGGSLTTGQINRALSDTADLTDFTLNSPSTTQNATNRYNILTFGTPTWS